MDALITHEIANVFGVSGAVTILLAYGLLSMEKLSSDTARYHWMNLIGALLIMVSLSHYWNIATFIMEIAWSSISIYGLVKAYRRKAV